MENEIIYASSNPKNRYEMYVVNTSTKEFFKHIENYWDLDIVRGFGYLIALATLIVFFFFGIPFRLRSVTIVSVSLVFRIVLIVIAVIVSVIIFSFVFNSKMDEALYFKKNPSARQITEKQEITITITEFKKQVFWGLLFRIVLLMIMILKGRMFLLSHDIGAYFYMLISMSALSLSIANTKKISIVSKLCRQITKQFGGK